MAGVQSIERAFALLRALAVGPTGVTDLAGRVNLPKSTVSRLLSALEAEGVVAQDHSGGAYRLGDGLADLTAGQSADAHLATAARPHLLDLAELTNETAGVATLDGLEVYYLDHVEAEHDVQVRDWTGERAPLHAVPSGLVILAASSPAFVDAVLGAPRAQIVPNTVVADETIRDRLRTITGTGYAWVHEEFAVGINSVAAPILDPDGLTRSALHVHGPSFRFPGERDPDRLGELVADTAQRLSDQIAGAREQPLA